MPTKPSYRRLWCVSCQDWKLFDKEIGEEHPYHCNQCKTPLNEDVVLGDIPKEKILEQRKRYAESKRREFYSMMNMFQTMVESTGFMGGIESREIVEDDAGQKFIDEERIRIEREEREALGLEQAKYAKVERNEKCPCGSGKKFKHCHISIM